MKTCRVGASIIALALVLGSVAASAAPVELAPSRVVYTTTLSKAKPGGDVVDASGTMTLSSGETCDAWTTEEHDQLTVRYLEGDVTMDTSSVDWEAKDGLRFRFSQHATRNGKADDDISGEARLDGVGQGGSVEFTRPNPQTMTLVPGVLFPVAHTIRLIQRAAAGDAFLAAKVLDGEDGKNAGDVSAVIGAPQDAAATAAAEPVKSPLLERPSWRVHLAFFPADASDTPKFQVDMRLLDNGVTRDMVLDYGDFSIKATLKEIETLPKPTC
jgi:EipB-like